MKYLGFFLLFLASATLHAQQQNKTCDDAIPQYNLPQNKVWAFGDSLGLDFNIFSEPMAIQTGMCDPMVMLWNCASASDSNGQLLFYTDGHTVWSANGVVMPNGVNLSSRFQFTQIVQVPFQQYKYYLFTLGDGMLKCSLIDMSLNNGLGVVAAPNFLVNYNVGAERCGAAVADCSGSAWLLVHDAANPIFRAFHITAAGIDTVPVISNLSNQIPNAAGWVNRTVMEVSPNGKKIAYGITAASIPYYKLTYYDFDPATGIVSNPQVLKTREGETIGSLAFSPDNSKLYCMAAKETPGGSGAPFILQYDFNSSLPDSLIEPDSIGSPSRNSSNNGHIGDLRLGPDGKIYFPSHWGDVPGRGNAFRALGRINYPNLSGASCGFEDSVASVDFSSLPVSGFFHGIFPNETVIPQSILQVDVQLQGDTLVAQPGNYGSYQWYLNGNPLANAQNPYLPITDTGLYAVKVTDTACNCTDSVVYPVTELPGLGIAASSGQSIRIYPNPTYDKIFVEAPMPLNLSLYDLTGRLLRQSKAQKTIDMSTFAEGVYLLRIEDNEGRFLKMEKVLKRE